ncbi:MAG TPA: YqgQ family protein [Bacillota bacterium]|nr:YqgQ family protein [Bacillota bacterium]
MNNMYDVQQLLKRYGIIIYTGKRMSDLQLMEIEVAELFKNQLITSEEYIKIKRVLHKELSNYKRRINR